MFKKALLITAAIVTSLASAGVATAAQQGGTVLAFAGVPAAWDYSNVYHGWGHVFNNSTTTSKSWDVSIPIAGPAGVTVQAWATGKGTMVIGYHCPSVSSPTVATIYAVDENGFYYDSKPSVSFGGGYTSRQQFQSIYVPAYGAAFVHFEIPASMGTTSQFCTGPAAAGAVQWLATW